MEHNHGRVEIRFRQCALNCNIAVWQKPSDNDCYVKKLAGSDVYPAMCDNSLEHDPAWYTSLRPCVLVLDPKLTKSALESLPKWPERLRVAPARISDVPGGSGGLAAALVDDPLWIMNVVSSYAPNTLLVVYDRDLIGNYHDWL
ncbi:hypothetical protein CXB51_031120 [Gossypium anomalum]|uniref:Methyltransferase n=1 Tax=Gossypium anomalum TaxID=47600 RepID=A0A8J5YBL7_9ROSI|nr:hypothetical protein CXB51_031120 [Gossypium anomalum]